MNASPSEIWETYGERLRRFVEARLHPGHDADDLLQDLYAKLPAGLAGVQNPDRLEAWLFQVARRAVTDHFRSRSAAPGTGDLPLDPIEPAVESTVSAELSSCLGPMLRELPDRDREALELADLAGLQQKEV